jgi:hypothetical protein
LGALVLSLTAVTVVAIGILAAFGAVAVILRAFAPDDIRPNKEKPVAMPGQARAAHAGGD